MMKKAKTNDRIREAMEIRGIKQAELVERTGIDKGQMSSYLSGKYKPKQRNIDLIAQALSVDEAWLMGYDVPMKGYKHEATQNSTPPKILQYYDVLNDIGKHEATKRVAELTEIPRYVAANDFNYVNAAHAIDGATDEDKQFDEDIMDDENF
jgi:transcriptional regulator with XRE-family HTH domain